jgi:uncharacterized FAD-dependent dehydrogenase
MPVRITNLSLPVEKSEAALPAVIAQRLKLPAEAVQRFLVLRKSLDARKRMNLQFVYSLMVELQDEAATLKKWKNDRDVQVYEPEVFDDPASGEQPLEERPVVVGTGPAGLLAGYYLALKDIVLC